MRASITLALLILNYWASAQHPEAAMKNVDYPFPVKYQKIADDIELAYLEVGQGPKTLLFVHGLGSYSLAWKKNIEKLQTNFRCIAVDLPNYGKSSSGDYPFTMSFFAEAIADFIRIKKLDNVILVGHSMGGQIALTLALQPDPPIEGLVLLAPAGFETFTEDHRTWFASLLTPESIRKNTPKQIEFNFNLNFHGNTMPESARFMYEDRLKMRADTAAYGRYCAMIPRCVAGMLAEPVFDRLAEVTLPTLIIYGKEDALIPNRILHPQMTTQQVAESGHEQLPNSQLKMLSPCGHFVQWDCAETVNEAIQNFVTD